MEFPGCVFVLEVVILFTNFIISQSNSQELANTNGEYSLDFTDDMCPFYQQSEFPRDCAEVMSRRSGSSPSGVYQIKPDGIDAPFDVYCDQVEEDGGWTVIQRRQNGHIDFNRSWTEFKDGFGFLSGEFWLGNEKLDHLTNQKNYQLHIDIEMTNGSSFSVTYDMFRVGDEWSGYKLLSLGGYNGTADFKQCPTNMVWGKCSCKATCAHPDVCEQECPDDEESCVCPEGFLLQEGACVSQEDCGCFEPEMGIVPEGASISNRNCSKRWSCKDNNLTYDVMYQCDTDCYDAFTAGSVFDGVHTIKPTDAESSFQVYCDMSNGGGWAVIQRRQDGSVDFYRDWAAYKAGFGTPTTELWLGNENLYHLTNQRNYALRIDFVTSDGVGYYMNYDAFRISNETSNYRLQTLGNFNGSTNYDYMAFHRGINFTTHDNDNDNRRTGNCASYHRGGWWYNRCYDANLNGDYKRSGHGGIALREVRAKGNATFVYKLRYTEMKIRPYF